MKGNINSIVHLNRMGREEIGKRAISSLETRPLLAQVASSTQQSNQVTQRTSQWSCWPVRNSERASERYTAVYTRAQYQHSMVLYYGLIQCITASNCSLGAHCPTWAAVQLSASDARTSGRHCCAAQTPKPVVTFISVSLYLNHPSPPTHSPSLAVSVFFSSYITQQTCCKDLLCDPLTSSLSLCIELHTVVSLTHKVVFVEERQGETGAIGYQEVVFVSFSFCYIFRPPPPFLKIFFISNFCPIVKPHTMATVMKNVKPLNKHVYIHAIS